MEGRQNLKGAGGEGFGLGFVDGGRVAHGSLVTVSTHNATTFSGMAEKSSTLPNLGRLECGIPPLHAIAERIVRVILGARVNVFHVALIKRERR